MSRPIVYTVFHINMAFSSIEEEERKIVIGKCYWPLLRLAESGLPIGIEATSYSLRAIAEIDPDWITKLKDLIQSGVVEFVGSGYAQLIAPLVPPDVTRWNLRLGQQDYEELLGIRPKIALVNEQAYSPGLVPLYLKAGFEAIMMDCSEPASHNKDWKRSYSRLPQMVQGTGDSKICVLWSDAISFQKFQRYAHGELDVEEYFEFLSLQLEAGVQAFPLYTSDAEVFDYRPGRFASETTINGFSEYERIRLLMDALQRSEDVRLALPTVALGLCDVHRAPIKLETVAAPVPVKKQRKYNVLRWAVSGQNDLLLNTHCWRLFKELKQTGSEIEADWRALCGYWASDYRTHITQQKWRKLNELLPVVQQEPIYKPQFSDEYPGNVKVSLTGRFIEIETDKLHLTLNTQRGLAIQSFGLGPSKGNFAGAPSENGLLGTIAHGFYQDIAFGADFYSGHFVFEPSGRHKVTDLARIKPTYGWDEVLNAVVVCCDIETPWGGLTKHIVCYPFEQRIEVIYHGDVSWPRDGSFRMGHVTLNPRAFDRRSLYYAAHNGGDVAERHMLWSAEGLVDCDHGASVSRLVSATTGLGMTSGILELGDDEKFVRLSMKREDAAGVGLITSKAVDDSFFVRASLSLCEVDETLHSNLSVLSSNVLEPIMRYSIEIGEHC